MQAVVVFLDVGQGDCTAFIDVTAKEALVVDCPDGCHQRLIQVLRHFGVHSIRLAVASHTHWDHIGGLHSLLSAFPSHELRFNHEALPSSERYERMKLRSAIRGFRGLEDARGLRLNPVLAEESGQVGSITWRCISPTYSQVLTALDENDRNHASTILKLQVGPLSVVVGGDADGRSWRQAFDRGEDLRADVLRLPHHGGEFPVGSGRASLDEILDVVGASHHVVSVGASNRYGHPSPGTLRALRARSDRARVLCTQLNGTCLGVRALPLPVVSPPVVLPDLPPRNRGHACAGTIIVRVDGDQWRVDPDDRTHGQVVAQLDNPMCRAETQPSARSGGVPAHDGPTVRRERGTAIDSPTSS